MDFTPLTYWNYGRRYCGIEYGSDSSGETVISCITALRRNGEFDLEKQIQFRNIEESVEHLSKNQHAFLCLTHNQVLIKHTLTPGSPVKVVSSAFPNIDLNDFYYQILETASGHYVALCRKKQVHQIIRSFEENHIQIVGFSLGISSIQNLLPTIENENIIASRFKLQNANNEVLSLERVEKQKTEILYAIGDTQISSRYLLPLSAIFNYPSGNHSSTNFENKNQELKKEHVQKVFFRKGLISSIIILLILLLTNTILYSKYYSEYHKLTSRYEAEISQKQTYDRKLLEIEQKEEIVQNISSNSNSRRSFYLNQLVANKPSSVLLSDLTYQPLKKQIKEKDPVSLEKNVLHIAGEIRNENDFSQWIKELEETYWIKEVEISDFSYNSTASSRFVMKINIKDDETIE